VRECLNMSIPQPFNTAIRSDTAGTTMAKNHLIHVVDSHFAQCYRFYRRIAAHPSLIDFPPWTELLSHLR